MSSAMLRVLYELKFTKNYKKGFVPTQSYSQKTLRPVKRPLSRLKNVLDQP